jgi:hypothetical protein
VGYKSRSWAGLLVRLPREGCDERDGSLMMKGTRRAESNSVILHHVLCSPVCVCCVWVLCVGVGGGGGGGGACVAP